MRYRWLAVPLVACSAVLIAACGSSGNSSTGAAAGSSAGAVSGSNSSTVMIKTRNTSMGTVLTNAAGMTLYWFAPDTSTASKCTGSCAQVWPPVLGTAAAAPGTTLPDAFGTITRSNGQKQVTYDGHPLYTYAADTAAGQVKGNGVNASGGLWWAITPTAAKLGSTSSSSGSSGSSGGYGY